MPISRIIAVENNLANILVESWHGVFQSYMTRLLIALKAGNPDAARKIVDTFTLDAMLDNLHKTLDAYTHMAFKYGTQQIATSSRATNDLHESAINLFKTSITQNVSVQVNKASQKVIEDFNKVQKFESILNEFKSFASNVTDAAERNLRMATQLHTSRLAAYGACAEMNVLGIKEYSINGQLDKRICPVCRVMHGRIFQVSDARSNLQKILNLKDPDKIKEYAPWPNVKEAANIARMSAEEIVIAGWQHPSWHGNCRCLIIKTKDVPELSMEAKPSSIVSGANRQKYVPNKWDFVSTGLDESPEVLAAWDRAFNISPMQLLSRLFGEPAGLMTRDFLGTRGFIAKLNQRDLEFEVNKSIFGSTHPIGFKGSISLETKSAVLDMLEFAEVDAAKAVDVLGSSIKGFEQAGIEVVNINANVGQGSFALARLGWCPRTPAEWRDLKNNYLKDSWAKMKNDVPDMVKTSVDSILASKDPQAIWELADIGYTVNGKGLGQTLLEDTQWWGALDLTDTHAMHRYHTFIN
jgi:hypothetical protein